MPPAPSLQDLGILHKSPPVHLLRRHFVGMWVSCAPDMWQMDTSASTQHTPARLLAIPPLSRL